MKLLTRQVDGVFHAGMLIGGDVLDLALARAVLQQAANIPHGVRAILAGGEKALSLVHEIAELAVQPHHSRKLRDAGAVVPLAEAHLGPVIPDPDLVLCGSMNSRGHNEEMNAPAPEHPFAFVKAKSALSASGADITPPPGHGDMIDWEGEVCVVIGTRCYRVAVEEAMEHVVGYTLLNDVSAREYVMPFATAKGASPAAQAWERNVLGKNYPTFAPIGPVITTKNELPLPFTYHIETLVNGSVMQSSTQDDLVFGPAEMISYFSQFYILQPGDIISLGSPPGVGMALKPPRFLKPGDTVEVRMEGIGSLVNRIASA